MALKDALFYPIAGKMAKSGNKTKITIVGIGAVGMAAAYTILVQGTCGTLALVDVAEDRIKGEVMDLCHGQQFLPNCNIIGGTDYKLSEQSDIVVICAGARQKEGESRLNLVQRNVDIFKGMVSQIVKFSPDCMIVVVSNPVDILSYVTWKISGFPRSRVFGTGTMLDSARFRYLLGNKLGVNPNSIHGYIIGEHGDHSVPVWSTVNVAGITLKSMLPKLSAPDDPDDFNELYHDVVKSALNIIKLKGYTSWAIGATIATLCSAILKNRQGVYALSTLTKHDGSMPQLSGIDKDIFLSLPCVITSSGISHVVPIKLTDGEAADLYKTAKIMEDIIRDIKCPLQIMNRPYYQIHWEEYNPKDPSYNYSHCSNSDAPCQSFCPYYDNRAAFPLNAEIHNNCINKLSMTDKMGVPLCDWNTYDCNCGYNPRKSYSLPVKEICSAYNN